MNNIEIYSNVISLLAVLGALYATYLSYKVRRINKEILKKIKQDSDYKYINNRISNFSIQVSGMHSDKNLDIEINRISNEITSNIRFDVDEFILKNRFDISSVKPVVEVIAPIGNEEIITCYR